MTLLELDTNLDSGMLHTGTLVLITVTKEVISDGTGPREPHFTHMPRHYRPEEILFGFSPSVQ